jgi:putative transposase
MEQFSMIGARPVMNVSDCICHWPFLLSRIDLSMLNSKRCYRSMLFLISRKMLKAQALTPRTLVTDKLKSCGAARKELMSSVVHFQDRYADNRVEASHQHTRQHERQMRRFKSRGQAQRFLSVHSQVHNLFRVGRHLSEKSQRNQYGRCFWQPQAISADPRY